MNRQVRVRPVRDIARPVDAVWQVLSDYAADPTWRSGVTDMEVLDPLPVRAGTRTREIIRVAGRTQEVVAHVTAAGPRRFDFASSDGAVRGHRAVTALTATTSRVTYALTFDLTGPLALAAPLIASAYRRRVRGDLARLDDIVSRRPVPTSA